MVDISIIVPVYNVEKYLAECLDSIIEQHFASMEVICIDDCSTDTSLDILAQYARKYSYIEIVQNEKNLGLAQTRNLGLEMAKGIYILFIDADDYLMPDTVISLYSECSKRNLDIMEFDAESFGSVEYEKEIITQRRVHNYHYDDSSGVEFLCRLIENKEIFGCVWNRMYKKEFLLSQQVRFIKGILHEDIPFTFRALIMAKRVGCYHKMVYCYRLRAGSIMHNSEYGQHWKGLWIGYADMMRIWHDFLLEDSHNERYSMCIGYYLDMIASVMQKYFKEYCLDSQKTTDSFSKYIEERNFIDNRTLDFYFSKEDTATLLRADSVLLFGAGKIAKEIIILLTKKEIPIRKIYVTNKKENSDSIAGIAVEQIDAYEEKNKDNVLVVAVSVKIQDEVEGIIKKFYEGIIVKTIAI